MTYHTLSARNVASGTYGSLLRSVLVLDAVACGIFAVAGIVGAAWLSPHFGLPESLFRGAALVIVPWIALLAVVATRSVTSSRVVGFVIVANLAWVVASFGLLISDAVSPTNLGVAFVIAQAAAVLAFAGLQFMGLRRGR